MGLTLRLLLTPGFTFITPLSLHDFRLFSGDAPWHLNVHGCYEISILKLFPLFSRLRQDLGASTFPAPILNTFLVLY